MPSALADAAAAPPPMSARARTPRDSFAASSLLSARRAAQAQLSAQREGLPPPLPLPPINSLQVQREMRLPIPQQSQRPPTKLEPLAGSDARQTPRKSSRDGRRPSDSIQHPVLRAPLADRGPNDLNSRVPLGSQGSARGGKASPRRLVDDLEVVPPGSARDEQPPPLERAPLSARPAVAAAASLPSADAAMQVDDPTTTLQQEEEAPATPSRKRTVVAADDEDRAPPPPPLPKQPTPRTKRDTLANAAEARFTMLAAAD